MKAALRLTSRLLALSALIATAAHSVVHEAPAPTTSKPDVTIKRDNYGVPHVYAASTYPLFYGFGYALAEDRLFQMEMTRRSSTGTVAEVLGARYLESDKRARQNFDPTDFARQFGQLPPERQQIIDGFAAGYNARVDEVLARPHDLLSKQFVDFGILPAHLSRTAVFAIFKIAMIERFGGFNSEIDNLALLSALRAQHGDQKGLQIWQQVRWIRDTRAPTTIDLPEQTSDTPPTFAANPADPKSNIASLVNASPMSAAAIEQWRSVRLARNERLGPDGATHASLGWGTGRSKTAAADGVYVDGAQMGFSNPSVVWNVGLHGAGFDVVGLTQVGVPLVEFGTNSHIAWGGTAGFGDTVDIYQEHLDPHNSLRYTFQGSYRDMTVRTEEIRVKSAPTVKLQIYSTIHGTIVLEDKVQHVAYSRKPTWAGRELETLFGWTDVTRATSYEQWTQALQHVAMSINFEYVDKQGNVAYYYTGLFPIRPPTQDMRLPASGSGDMEWQGLRSYRNNPHVLNPKSGYVASWNNKPQLNYNNGDTIYWGSIDHVQEIRHLLDAEDSLRPQDTWDVIRGVSFVDGAARNYLAVIRNATSHLPPGDPLEQVIRQLTSWDGKTIDPGKPTTASTGFTIFSTFLPLLQKSVLDPAFDAKSQRAMEQGDESFSHEPLSYVSWEFPTVATQATLNALLGSQAGTERTYDFLHGKTRDEVIHSALALTAKTLTERFGPDVTKWHSPAAPHVFEPTNFQGVPINTADRKVTLPVEMNRATFNFWVTFKDGQAKLCDVLPPGQSDFIDHAGRPGPHGQDQLKLYESFGCKDDWLTLDQVARNTERSQTLVVHREK